MPRMVLREAATQRVASHSYRFTVVFQPIVEESRVAKKNGGSRSSKTSETGYQVTVPLLPGVVTYGRTLAEAREMAADAIRVHLEGLRKDGEPIPDERTTRTEKVRVALTA